MSNLSEEHRAYLASQAVDPDLAERLGVRTVASKDDVEALGDDSWVNFRNFPAILFPWKAPDGRVQFQARPDNPTTDQKTKKPRKYVFARGDGSILWAVREVEGATTILIVEGTKQGLAAATHAPPDVSVYSIAGCRNWQLDGAPIADLMVADGMNVVVILDADAATNPDVYAAGVKLSEALSLEGASKIDFARMIGGAKSGLDDILASRPADRRADYLARIIASARPKPADKVPARTGKKGGTVPTPEDGRVLVVINEDRLEVIDALTDSLLKKWNSTELFNHGGVISRRKGATMHPVDKGSFRDLIQITCRTVSRVEGAQGVVQTFGWPDVSSMDAVASRADYFARLERLVQAPFVRPDGSIVTSPGYDEATRTLLMPDECFEGMTIPETPTPDEVSAAREFLLTEWLGDFPLDEQADRANLLALVLTPAIRGMMPRAPMAVVDGLQMGVGKNLLADVLLTVYTGQAARPMNFVDDHDELRKQITSAFRTGAPFFVFDEAPVVQGAALAQALTAETWQDRILGVSTMANFPNRVTWISLGNNVQVKGDITRRVYRIALRPRYANPHERRAETFRHPGTSGLDLLTWTGKHRKELLTAILTLVRAWYAADQPYPKRGVSFGSFEIWERMLGGILEVAGVEDFLGNLKVWRSESDFDTQYWTNHMEWLREQFTDQPFRTGDVRAKALTIGLDHYAAPPKLDDPTEKTYGKALGEAYGRVRGRRYNGLWLDRVGTAHGHVSVYRVFSQDDLPEGPAAGPTPPPDPEPVLVTDDDCAYHGMGQPCSDGRHPDTEESIPELDAIERPHETLAGYDEKEREDRRNSCSWPEDCPHVDQCANGCTVPTGVQGGDWLKEELGIPAGGPFDTLPPGGIDREELARTGQTQGFRHHLYESADAAVLVLDLETGDAKEQYVHPGPGYTRIGATARDGEEVQAYNTPETVFHLSVPANVVADIRTSAVATGHNIMAFDLPVLVREGVMDMPEVHRMAAEERLADTILMARYLDPPMARDKGVDAERKYDLGTLAEKYDLGSKLTEVSHALAKKYGGWNDIPIDVNDPDPERAADAADFIRYMVGDVEVSRRLYGHLLAATGGRMPDYVRREHRVAAIAAQISMNGFLVDQELLAERVAGVEATKGKAMRFLAARHGVPTTDAKGNDYKSPLATKAGKEAIGAALIGLGVPEKALWRTPKARDLQLSSDAMIFYGREYGQNNPELRKLASAVHAIVSARSVYHTIQDTMRPDGRVHPNVSMSQATGRWSLTAPGLTVLGKRGGRHVERAVLLPDPGEVLVAFDLSQVDMRAVAGLSQDQAYIEMLKKDDPHAELAFALFGDRGMRETAKPIGHGWNYGESLRRISQENDIEPKLVAQFDRMMHERFGRLVEWREEVRALAESGALLDNGFGRPMRPDPQRAHTQGPALMGQGAARDLMMTGMLRLPAECLPMLRAQVHDEIVLSIPTDQVEDVSRAVIEALSFDWEGVPILADRSRAGTSWAMCYSKD